MRKECDIMSDEIIVKRLFYCRICLWAIAVAATVYWIYWSFHLYTLGYMDEHEYAVVFRPIFSKGLFISLGAVCVSFVLRRISDYVKDKAKKSNMTSNL